VEKLPRKKPPLTKKKLAGRDLSRFATPVDALPRACGSAFATGRANLERHRGDGNRW
jgi:hypothetical protein